MNHWGNGCKEGCCASKAKDANILEVVNDYSVDSVNSAAGRWKSIEAMADSGAADSGSEQHCGMDAVSRNKNIQAGLKYNAAEGSEIKNIGETELNVVNDNGEPGRVTIQIGDKINKLLATVCKIWAGRKQNNLL